MQANLSHLLSSASAWTLSWSEPVVLLVLGALFLALSFTRIRRPRPSEDAGVTPVISPAKPRPVADTRAPLVAHQR